MPGLILLRNSQYEESVIGLDLPFCTIKWLEENYIFYRIVNYGVARIVVSEDKSTDNHSGFIYLLTLENYRCDKLPISVSVLMPINISWLLPLTQHPTFQRGNYKTLISLRFASCVIYTKYQLLKYVHLIWPTLYCILNV